MAEPRGNPAIASFRSVNGTRVDPQPAKNFAWGDGHWPFNIHIISHNGKNALAAGRGSVPDPGEVAYSAPHTPLLDLGRNERKEKEGRVRKMWLEERKVGKM